MIKVHNSNMLVEIGTFVALAITVGVIYLTLKQVMPRFASYIYQKTSSKVAEKHKETNRNFIDYICYLKNTAAENIFVFIFTLIFMTLLINLWVIYRSIGYHIYYTYPHIEFTIEYCYRLLSNIRFVLILNSVVWVIFLVLLILQLMSNHKYIGKKIKFYYHERETNEYLNNFLSSTSISLEQINDILLKHDLGLIESSSFIKIREYCLSKPNTGISNYILTQTTKSDINLDDLLAAYELKNNGFIYDTVYLQIKHNFMHNAQISAYELNDLFEEIANKTIDVTPDEFAIKRIHLMNSMVDTGEKIKDIKMILEVIQDKGIISKEEYKLKLSQYRNK